MRRARRAGTFPRVWPNPVSRFVGSRGARTGRGNRTCGRSGRTSPARRACLPARQGPRPVCVDAAQFALARGARLLARPSRCRTALNYPNSTASVCSTGMWRWARSARTLRAFCGGGGPINPEVFAMLFGALQRSAETARSAFYAFVIVYAAMLFYAMNTYVYPVSQHLLSTVQEQIGSGRDCEPGHVGPLCLRAAPPLDRLNAEYAAHVLGYFQDRSTDERVFHVPLIGLNSDRNWFWLINVAGSFLLYTLIRGAVQKYHQLAEYPVQRKQERYSPRGATEHDTDYDVG